MLQGTFRHMGLDVCAAISDEGTIQRSDEGQARRATKADAIPAAIQRQINGYRTATYTPNPNLKTFSEAPRAFEDAEVLRVARFLCASKVFQPFVTNSPMPRVRMASTSPEARANDSGGTMRVPLSRMAPDATA